MSNSLNSGSVSALKANETLLVRAITSSGDKIGFEFHEVIDKGDGMTPGINMTYLANTSPVVRDSQQTERISLLIAF